jgi:hypothetical protein
MIINVILFVMSIPLYILSLFSGLINSVFPAWFTSGITNIMGGTGILNTVFPMYPHPGMAGLAGQMGIMTVFGWAMVLMGYMITMSLAYKFIKILLTQFSIGQGPSIGTGGR